MDSPKVTNEARPSSLMTPKIRLKINVSKETDPTKMSTPKVPVKRRLGNVMQHPDSPSSGKRLRMLGQGEKQTNQSIERSEMKEAQVQEKPSRARRLTTRNKKS